MSAKSRTIDGFSATMTDSVQDARKDLTNLLKAIDRVPQEVLARHAQQMKAEMIAQTPYKTGKLEASVYCRVSQDKRRPGIVAGASAIDWQDRFNYAGIQHENTKFRHPIKGKAHYISEPFHKHTALIGQEIAQLLDDKIVRIKWRGSKK